MPTVVLFGGSFNPVHMGHVFTACYLAHLGMFDEVLVVPVFKHPYNKNLIEYHHRHEMCRLAMSWIPKVTISDVEQYLFDKASWSATVEPNYTVQTVSYLKAVHPDWNIYFAVGSDNSRVSEWHGSERLLQLATPFVIGRAGHPDKNDIAILPQISSTEIRKSLAENKHGTIAKAFLPEGVLDYIKKNGLYDGQNDQR